MNKSDNKTTEAIELFSKLGITEGYLNNWQTLQDQAQANEASGQQEILWTRLSMSSEFGLIIK